MTNWVKRAYYSRESDKAPEYWYDCYVKLVNTNASLIEKLNRMTDKITRLHEQLAAITEQAEPFIVTQWDPMTEPSGGIWLDGPDKHHFFPYGTKLFTHPSLERCAAHPEPAPQPSSVLRLKSEGG